MSRRFLRVGVVCFDFPPQYDRGTKCAGDRRSSLPALLQEQGYEAILPLPGAGIATPADSERCAAELRARAADCLLLDLFHWTRIPLAVGLLRAMDLLACLRGVAARASLRLETFARLAGLHLVRCAREASLVSCLESL